MDLKELIRILYSISMRILPLSGNYLVEDTVLLEISFAL